MGKPYSIDLRERVVSAVVTGGMSCNRAAEAIRGGHQHRYQLGEARAGDWQRRIRQDGRTQAKADFGRASPLAIAADQGWRLYPARAGLRARRTRAEGGLSVSLGVRPCREAEFQKKARWLANATIPTSHGGGRSGQGIKIASSLSAWSSSTRPGPGPTWPPEPDRAGLRQAQASVAQQPPRERSKPFALLSAKSSEHSPPKNAPTTSGTQAMR